MTLNSSDQDRINSLETEWGSIESSYRITPYNAPLNRDDERQKVFESYKNGKPYNPQFVYAQPTDFPLIRIEDFLRKLQPDKSVIEAMYFEKASCEMLAMNSVLTHSPLMITDASTREFGVPDENLMFAAKRILSENQTEGAISDNSISDVITAERIQAFLVRIQLLDWKCVVFHPLNAQISVHRLDKEIRIRKGANFSERDLMRLIVHEVGVHVLRYNNGAKQSLRLFENNFPGYLSTEEGLAAYSEDRTNLLDISTLRKYAGRVLAADLARNNSFYDVFCELVNYLTPDIAFDIIVRTKRGFQDTSQAGVHIKDIVYLQGYLNVKAHLENNIQDWNLLFVGKIGLQHLGFVRSLISQGWATVPNLDHTMEEIIALWDHEGA